MIRFRNVLHVWLCRGGPAPPMGVCVTVCIAKACPPPSGGRGAPRAPPKQLQAGLGGDRKSVGTRKTVEGVGEKKITTTTMVKQGARVAGGAKKKRKTEAPRVHIFVSVFLWRKECAPQVTRMWREGTGQFGCRSLSMLFVRQVDDFDRMSLLKSRLVKTHLRSSVQRIVQHFLATPCLGKCFRCDQ